MINITEETITETSAEESTQESTPEVDQAQAEADSSGEESSQEGKSETDQGDEDSFFDPNTVPEELKPAYKQMQAAFTKKTQEIAQARKEAEAIRQRAEAYDKVSPYIPLIEEMAAMQKTSQETPEMKALETKLRAAGYNDEVVEMMKLGAQFTLDQFNQTQNVKDTQRFVTGKIDEASNLDPRLNDTSLVYQTDDGEKVTYGQMVEEMVAADPRWMKDPVAATKRAIKKIDALTGKAKIEGKQELSAKAKTNAAKFPTTSSSPQGAVDKSQPKTIHEAYEQAVREAN